MLGKGTKRVRATISNEILIIRVERCHTTIFNHLSSSEISREVLKTMRRKLFELFEQDALSSFRFTVNQVNEKQEMVADTEEGIIFELSVDASEELVAMVERLNKIIAQFDYDQN